ncbi:MAG: NAD-dependent epimerase/dehydratase family protein [Candidatus Baltobacteraceae bacterium]
MNVLITGAAGFLGSHLAQAYLREGSFVTGVDNFATSSDRNLAVLSTGDGFTFVRADVSRELPVPAAKPDLILHFASPASPVDYARDPLGTLAVNGAGTMNCCELARQTGARLVFASTSEVYGDPLVHPQPEDYWGNVNSFGARSCYDEGKRYGEAAIASYRSLYGIDARIVRIFNTYGPRMRARDGRVVPAFISQALAGEALTVFGEGRQTRSLCYVDDLLEGVRRFAALEQPRFPLLNLGSDREVSVNEIARIIAGLCGVPLRVTHAPLPADDPSRRRPDLHRARAMLGWEPATSLEDGLRATIAWFAQQRSSGKEALAL